MDDYKFINENAYLLIISYINNLELLLYFCLSSYSKKLS